MRKFGAGVFVPRSADPAAALRAAVPAGVDELIDAAALCGLVIDAVRDGGAFVCVLGAGPAAERGIRVSQVRVHSDAGQLAGLAALDD